MKKYILLTVFGIASISFLSAQTNNADLSQKSLTTAATSQTSGEQKWADQRTDKLASLITLTEVQKSDINTINLHYAKRLSFLQDSKTIAPEALVQMKSDLFNYRISEYKRVLTTDQAVKIDSFLLELKTDSAALIEK